MGWNDRDPELYEAITGERYDGGEYCRRCNGTGEVGANDCPKCEGSGDEE